MDGAVVKLEDELLSDVDDSLQTAGRIFRENCNETIKLTVINEQLLKDLKVLLNIKFGGIIELNLYGNTLRIKTSYDKRLSARDIVEIEDLIGCKLDRVEDSYSWFDLDIDGRYNDYTFHRKYITDFMDDYSRIRGLIFK